MEITPVEVTRGAIVVHKLPEWVHVKGRAVEVPLAREESDLVAGADEAISKIKKAHWNGDLPVVYHMGFRLLRYILVVDYCNDSAKRGGVNPGGKMNAAQWQQMHFPLRAAKEQDQ